jgi:hypothetical protein
VQGIRDTVGAGVEVAPGERAAVLDEGRLLALPLAVQGENLGKERGFGREPAQNR